MEQPRLVFELRRSELHFLQLRPDSAGEGIWEDRLQEPLGQGGFGKVLKAFTLEGDTGGLVPCATKHISLKRASDPIEQEFRMLQAVKGISGTVEVLRPPIYTSTEGVLVTG